MRERAWRAWRACRADGARASFLTKMLTVNDRQIKFEMWDTAGQERYRALAPMYYRNADAAVLVYGALTCPPLPIALTR